MLRSASTSIFFIERFLFTFFGHTEWVARVFPALCGIFSVWAIYFLGKELLNKKLGLVAALLTSINFFNIEYSQEARNYILALLFATFSYLYFIRLIKTLGRKDMFLYVLSTVLMLYTHYYSIFILAAQGLVATILLFGQKDDKKLFLMRFSLAGAVIVVCYLPWVPFIIEMSKIHSFWISPIQSNFAVTYFFDYFGNNELLHPFLVLLLTYFCWQAFSQQDLRLNKIKESPLQLTFLVFFVAVTITYLLPYLRSVLVVPMLFNRYTIVVLPAFIIAIAFAFVLIKNRVVLSIMLTIFVALTLMDHLIVRKYYSDRIVRKTQFREMTQYITEDPNRIFPIVEERTPWQHKYYLKVFHNDAPVLSGNKEATVDSILNKKRPEYDLEAFWIVGAHASEPHLLPETKTRLETKFILVKEKEFYDAWAQLYVSMDSSRNSSLISSYEVSKYFSGKQKFYNTMVIPIWAGAIISRPILTKPGSYKIIISHMGTKAGGIYPHIKVTIDGNQVGEFFTDGSFGENNFQFEIKTESSIIIKLDFDNDLTAGGEDRNAFIKAIFLEKMSK